MCQSYVKHNLYSCTSNKELEEEQAMNSIQSVFRSIITSVLAFSLLAVAATLGFAILGGAVVLFLLGLGLFSISGDVLERNASVVAKKSPKQPLFNIAT